MTPPSGASPSRRPTCARTPLLQLEANVASGLVVHAAVIGERLARALPFLVVEEVLLAGVEAGGDRQELHERVRRHAMEARRRLDEGASDNDFLDRVAADPSFGLDRDRLEALGAAGGPGRPRARAGGALPAGTGSTRCSRARTPEPARP